MSQGADLTAEVGIRLSALHHSLIAQRKKNNLVFVSACLSMAVKLADGRLAGVPGRGKRGRKEAGVGKAGKERIGILGVKNAFLFSAFVSIPSHPLQSDL